MNIVLATNAASLSACTAAVSSLALNLPANATTHITILHEEPLPSDGCAAITNALQIAHTPPSIRFAEVKDTFSFGERFSPMSLLSPMVREFSPAGHLSLYIPQVFNGGRALYVDSTVLVKASLRRLYETDISGRPIGGCPLSASLASLRQPLYACKPSSQFSVSLLLWNLEVLGHDFPLHLSQHFETAPDRFLALDFQDALNSYFAGDSFVLPYVWENDGNGIADGGQANRLRLVERKSEECLSPTDGEDSCLAVHYRGGVLQDETSGLMQRMLSRLFSRLPALGGKGYRPSRQPGSRVQALHAKALSAATAVYNRYIKGSVLRIMATVNAKDTRFIRETRDTLLFINACNRREKSFDPADMAAHGKPVLTFEKTSLHRGRYGIKQTYHLLFGTRHIIACDELDDCDFSAAYFHVFRNAGIRNHIRLLLMRQMRDFPVYFVECGFIQSITNVNDDAIPMIFRRVNSYLVDDMGFYFDAYIPSRIESHLNSAAASLTQEQTGRVRNLMKRIRGEKWTKYNYQPIDTPELLKQDRKRVLVVDQSRKDASIVRGMADAETFSRMLEEALAQNPDAQIIIKTHPDSISRQRGCYYSSVKESDRILKITESANPLSVLERVDKVYVCSSLLGLEALVCGKEVHVFGMPVYAGWGLTHDRLQSDRRERKVTLEELLYACYIKYAVYFDPVTGNRCEVEDILDALTPLREQYEREFGGRKWNCGF